MLKEFKQFMARGNVLDLVVRIPRQLGRVRDHRHNEGEADSRPEGRPGRATGAPIGEPQSVTTSLPTARRSRSAAMASPARSSG